MEKIVKITSVVVFFMTILFFTIHTIIMPKTRFSDVENRSLASFPQFTAASYVNESFMNNVESYISDHFAFRTSLYSVKVSVDRLFGKNIINGVLFFNDRFISPVAAYDSENAAKNIAAVNDFADNSKAPVYVMIAPTSAGIYGSDIPSYYKNVDQRSIIDNMSNQFSDKIIFLNPFSRLYSLKDEYIYYRNDHHWTAYGAFVAYSATIKLMGYNPVSFSNCDVEHVNSDFYGTFYSRTLYDGFKADVIDNIHIKGGYSEQSVETDTGSEIILSDSIYHSSYLETADKYGYYLGSALFPSVKITTNFPEENKLLVIKDSYAHSFVPYLTQHFSEITMLDLRSISLTAISEVIDTADYDRILILYNFEDFMSDTDLRKLSFVAD